MHCASRDCLKVKEFPFHFKYRFVTLKKDKTKEYLIQSQENEMPLQSLRKDGNVEHCNHSHVRHGADGLLTTGQKNRYGISTCWSVNIVKDKSGAFHFNNFNLIF